MKNLRIVLPTDIEDRYYKYVSETEKIQKQLKKLESQISFLYLQMMTKASTEYRNEICLIESSRTKNNLAIMTEYMNDLKKHSIKYSLFSKKKDERKKIYEEEISKNNVFYEAQKSILKEQMKPKLDNEQNNNTLVREKINGLRTQCNELSEQLRLLREDYYGDNSLKKILIKK